MEKQRKMWTEQEIKLFYELWNTKTLDDVCKELHITINQAQYMALQIRKAGYKLQKKHKKGQTQNLILVALKDIAK